MTTQFNRVSNDSWSTLSFDIAADATSLTIDDATGWPEAPFAVTCGSEVMRCTNRSGAVLSVTRAAEGSSAAVHSTGDRVSASITKGVFYSGTKPNFPQSVRGTFGYDTYAEESFGSTLNLRPHQGDEVQLYDSVDGLSRNFTMPSGGIALNLAGHSGVYDAFLFYNGAGDSIQAELTKWNANNSARVPTSGVTYFGGMYVRADDPRRRYVLSLYVEPPGSGYDLYSRRLVSHSPEFSTERPVRKDFSFSTYSHSGTATRPVNNDDGNRIEFLVGLDNKTLVDISASVFGYQAITTAEDSDSLSLAPDTILHGSGSTRVGSCWPYFNLQNVEARYKEAPAAGFHQLFLLEKLNVGNTIRISGYDPPRAVGGIEGTIQS